MAQYTVIAVLPWPHQTLIGYLFTERMDSSSGSRKSSELGARASAGKRRQVSLDGHDDKPYQMSGSQNVGE